MKRAETERQRQRQRENTERNWEEEKTLIICGFNRFYDESRICKRSEWVNRLKQSFCLTEIKELLNHQWQTIKQWSEFSRESIFIAHHRPNYFVLNNRLTWLCSFLIKLQLWIAKRKEIVFSFLSRIYLDLPLNVGERTISIDID